MTILKEIHTWSKGLPAWQQDAIARIYANRDLSAADIEDLYALAKAEKGIDGWRQLLWPPGVNYLGRLEAGNDF